MGEASKRERGKKLVTTCRPSSAVSILNEDIYSLEFDGASKGNPGRAGAGAILKGPDGTVVCQLTRGVGIATCNFAEYQALIMGLQAALDRGIHHIKAQGDSKLVCSQVMGTWKVHSPNLSTSFAEAMKLKERFQSFSIQHVYREFNSAADTLANTATALPVDEPQIHCSTSLARTETLQETKVGRVAMRSVCSWQDTWDGPTNLSSLSQEKEVYRINYHGASNGKYAGAGVVLYSPDGTLHSKINQGLGVATRNVAQYQALVIGLRAALDCNVSHVQIQGDALLVFKQMTGTTKVNDEKLQANWREANDLLTRFSKFSITRVDKCQNSLACALAEVALKSSDCGLKIDDTKIVSTLTGKGSSFVSGCETLKIQTCTAGIMNSNKMATPMGSSMRSLYTAAGCSHFPTSCPGLFFPSCEHQVSRVLRGKPPQPLSKCPLIYPARTLIHKIVLQFASRRVRINPHIFPSSLMHIQAVHPMYKSAFSAPIFQVYLQRSF